MSSSPLHDYPLHDSHLHDSLQLDSNEFCTTLRLPGRVYEAVETPDNPKAIIHHSKIDYVEKVEDILGKEEFSLIENSHIGSILIVVKRNRVQFSEELCHFLMQRRVLTQGEDLWFTFSDQPMRAAVQNNEEAIPLVLGKNDKFTVRTLYEMFTEKARSMPTLERLSLGTSIITEAVNEDVEPPLQNKFKADTDNVPLRRSERGQISSIHTQPPFTGARKKHPILHPFEPVDKTRKEKMREWKMSNKKKKLRINQEIVTAKWFSDIETPGKKLSKMHIEAGFELLKLRQINNPDLFLNKTALVVGVKFLEEINELYDEFLDDKKVAEKYWLGVVVNLEKRSITAFNCAAMKFTDASLVPYVNAYAMAFPFMIRNFFKDVSMDTSKFSIKNVSEGFPHVLKIEDGGVYALKLIECHAMRIVDLTKLSEEKIAIIREKLAVDIFSELQ
uniref:Ubiquitin-like protease family profile domain-containing protein n=1 Tax=Brassica oleracea var. oleracea TaxID=109376 RepID=A0A0D3AUN7_BRAOL